MRVISDKIEDGIRTIKEELTTEEAIKMLDEYASLPFDVRQKDKLREELGLNQDVAEIVYNNIKFLSFIFKLSEIETSLMLNKLIDTAQEKMTIEHYEKKYSEVLNTIEKMRPSIEANRSDRALQDNAVGDSRLNNKFQAVLRQIQVIQSTIEKKKEDPAITEKKKKIVESIEKGERYTPTIIKTKTINRLKTYSNGKVV